MKRNWRILLIAVFAVLLLTNAAFAALDLGVDEITLDPGEFYEFTPQEGTVYWFVSDESVLELGGSERLGVTALAPGTAVVFAMAEDSGETDSCVVTVTGEAKAVKSADLYYQDLTAEDLAKVNDPALAAVLSLANNTAAFPMGIGDLSGFDYKVLIVVKDGSQQKVADAAEAMGLTDTWAYEFINMAALCGDANDISRLLIEYRDDIVSVETDVKYTLDSDETETASGGVTNLQGNAETLSNINAIHALGFTGEGQYVAIVDTGVKADHEQFIDADGNSRVEYQHCYSAAAANVRYTTIIKDEEYYYVYERRSPVCAGTTTEAGSSEPSGAKCASSFNHGTHVAGIAAGKDGVAPDAKIIAVQAFTEFVYYKVENGKITDTIIASDSSMYSSDANKAMEYIKKLIDKGVPVASVNMSYGGEPDYYDYTDYYSDKYLSYFLEKGTIPCGAAGNDGVNWRVNNTAASRYTFAVGALDNQAEPVVVDYSNHSKLVDILAPGTGIHSAIYTDEDENDAVTPGSNGYANWQGTSMATPMVAGAFALLRQMYPESTADELENFMLSITKKIATRAEVTKPVLNFDHITEYYITEPTAADYTVGSGNRTITVTTHMSSEHNPAYAGFKVAVYTSAGKLYKTEFVTADAAKTVTFTGLTNNAVYNVKVWGYKEVNGMKYLSDVVTTPMVPMAAQTGLTLSASGSDSVTAAWKNHSKDTIKVEYSDKQDFSVIADSCEGTGSCTISGLKTNTTYYFRFYWLNENCKTYSPASAAYTYYIPAMPTAADYEVGNGSKTISVKLKPNASFDGYKVELYLGEKLKSTKTIAVTTKAMTITFTNLVNNSVYDVKVYAYKTVSRVKYYSAPAASKMAPMAVPTGLELTINDGTNTVTAVWTGHDSEKISVEYAVDGGNYSEYCSGTGTCTGSAALEENTVYFFRFSWLNTACGLYSPVSAEQSRMLIEKPKAEDAKTLVGYKKIRVYFDDVESLTGHQIKTYIVSTGKLVSTVNVKRTANPEYADITRLTNDVEYRFEIYAYRTVGKTTYYSDPVTVYATPQLKPVAGDAPKGVKASGGAKKITVSWEKDTWTGGHYIELYRTDNYVMVANAYAANNAVSYTFSGGNIEYDVPYLVRVWKYNEKSPKAVGNKYVDTYAVSLATPGAPMLTSASGSLGVSWTYSGIAKNFEVAYATSNKGPFTVYAVTDAKSGTIPNLLNGTPYYVKVRAAYTLDCGTEDTADDVTVTSDYSAVEAAMPLPVSDASDVTVTTGSKMLTVSYSKVAGVDGHIIQLYKVDSKGKMSLVKTVTSADKTASVDVKFSSLANDTNYFITICAYKKSGSTTYRGAIYTSAYAVPSATAAETKEVLGVTEMTEPFDGFVDPVGELNAESDTDEAVDVEIKEEEKQPSIFDLFRL